MRENIKLVKKFEGDRFFRRNFRKIENEKLYIEGSQNILNFFKLNSLKIRNILEIGCCSGYQLNKYKNFFEEKFKKSSYTIKCYGLDLSKRAIKYGKKKYSGLKLYNLSSLQIDKLKKNFDVIICGYFLYLLDRKYLFKQFDLIYKNLKTNGYLIINDLDPLFTHFNSSAHTKKINSYKMNYSNFLENSNLFKKIYLHKWKTPSNLNKKFLSSDLSVAVYQKIEFEKNFPKNV